MSTSRAFASTDQPISSEVAGLRRAMATVCVSGTLDDKIAAAAAAGFDGIELFENDLVVAPWSPAEVRARCADLGLTIDLYQPFRDFEAVPPELLAANLARAEHKFDVMAELGTDTDPGLLLGRTGGDRRRRPRRRTARRCWPTGPRPAGMRIAYEALAWGRHVSTWDHSWRIVAARRPSGARACASTRSTCCPARSARTASPTSPRGKIFFLQLADAPHLSMDVLQWSRHHRLFPGQGSFDLTGFVRRVLAAGYTGPLSLEVFNDVFRQADPVRDRGRRDALADRPGGQPAPGHRRGRGPPSAAAPALTGHAFTEFGVDGRSGPVLQDALRGLGFTHTGQHRSKPVQLWEQGACRVILNSAVTRPQARAPRRSAPSRSPAPTRNGPGPAPRRCSRRPCPGSAARGRPTSPRSPPRTAPRCSSAATTTTGGPTSCPPATKARRRRRPHRHRPSRAGPAVRPLRRGRAVLPLGARAHPVDDRGVRRAVRADAVPGLRHRRTAAVRLAAHRRPAAPRRLGARRWPTRSTSPSPPTDIFATAAAIDRLGGATMPVPDNYYADLTARFALPGDLVDRLRRHGILYDRDAGRRRTAPPLHPGLRRPGLLRDPAAPAAATTASARPTHRSGWPRTATCASPRPDAVPRRGTAAGAVAPATSCPPALRAEPA